MKISAKSQNNICTMKSQYSTQMAPHRLFFSLIKIYSRLCFTFRSILLPIILFSEYNLLNTHSDFDAFNNFFSSFVTFSHILNPFENIENSQQSEKKVNGHYICRFFVCFSFSRCCCVENIGNK